MRETLTIYLSKMDFILTPILAEQENTLITKTENKCGWLSSMVRFNRWKDFALRMAKTCYARNRRPGREWIVNVLEQFFIDFESDDIECIVNWDGSDPYPPGNPLAGRVSDLSYCGCDGWRFKHANTPNPACDECHGSGLRHRPFEPTCVTDVVSEFLDGYCGCPPRCPSCLDYDLDEDCKCEEIEERFYEQWEEQWNGPVLCCIRAGLDCAFAESAGVLGFTAGDLRKMYPEGVPVWVVGADAWDMISIEAVVPGVGFVPSEPKPNGTFEELQDDAAIWL